MRGPRARVTHLFHPGFSTTQAEPAHPEVPYQGDGRRQAAPQNPRPCPVALTVRHEAAIGRPAAVDGVRARRQRYLT